MDSSSVRLRCNRYEIPVSQMTMATLILDTQDQGRRQLKKTTEK